MHMFSHCACHVFLMNLSSEEMIITQRAGQAYCACGGCSLFLQCLCLGVRGGYSSVPLGFSEHMALHPAWLSALTNKKEYVTWRTHLLIIHQACLHNYFYYTRLCLNLSTDVGVQSFLFYFSGKRTTGLDHESAALLTAQWECLFIYICTFPK